MKQKIYSFMPNFLQNILISLYNYKEYKIRYGGHYGRFLKLFKSNQNLTRDELVEINRKRYEEFLRNAINRSSFYNKIYKDIPDAHDVQNIHTLPVLSKETLRSNIHEIVIETVEKLHPSKTGGTTGKSLTVYYTSSNTQERFALLDDFRSRFGYRLGRKTAWFSGKKILTTRDVKSNRFWKTDIINKVRYYSTFHIKEDYLKYFIEDLFKFRPEFFIGFPSTMLEIAKYGLSHNYSYPENTIKAIFPTAETVTKDMREIIERFFKTKMYNQYASSEGAPFILECEAGNLHLELQSGVFEVLDHENKPAQTGRLIVTSFTTEGTPLIRYDIGDSVVLEDPNKICSCGNNNPMALEILGRIDDYVYSTDTGKINLGNVSNTLKDTSGIRSFQVVQDVLQTLEIYLIVDPITFTKQSEVIFLRNWKERVGKKMAINLHYVKNIPVEASGKFRIVKNNIKHLIDV